MTSANFVGCSSLFRGWGPTLSAVVGANPRIPIP